jgi:hypothetical protein
MSGKKVFWMRESLERDFFVSDNENYTQFLTYASVLASAAIGVGSLEAPLNALGGLKDGFVKNMQDKLTEYAKDKFKDKMDDEAKSLFERAFIAGHGEIPKGKVTQEQVKKGWIDLGQKAVLFLLTLPAGGSPIAGVLLLFPVLDLLHKIDTAKKHDRYDEIINSMMTKYTNIVIMAEKKRAARVSAERATALAGVDFNDAVHTSQDERLVFQGTDRQQIYQITQLQVARTRDQLRTIKGASRSDSIPMWNKQYNPDTMTDAELARIYVPFKKLFDATNAFDKRQEIIERIDKVMRGKSGILDYNSFVPVQGTGANITDDEANYTESMDEAIANKVPQWPNSNK